MKIKKFTICMLIFLLINTPSYASEGDKYLELKQELAPIMQELEKDVSNVALSLCLDILGPLYDAATVDFLQFLDTHYSSGSSTSTLNPTAVMKYIDYKRYISEQTINLKPQLVVSNDKANMIEELKGFIQCEGLGASYIELSKMKMYEYARTNASVKKSSIVTEAFAPINEEMRELGFSFAKMYGYFMAFRDKLPGFLSDCL